MCMDETVQFKCYLLAHNIFTQINMLFHFQNILWSLSLWNLTWHHVKPSYWKLFYLKIIFSKDTVKSSGLVQPCSMTNGVGRPMDPSTRRWGREKKVKGREMCLKTKQWQRANGGNWFTIYDSGTWDNTV